MPTPNETPANGQDAMQEFERLLNEYSYSLEFGSQRDETTIAWKHTLRAYVLKMAADSQQLTAIKTAIKNRDSTIIIDGADMTDHGWLTYSLRGKAIDAARRPTP